MHHLSNTCNWAVLTITANGRPGQVYIFWYLSVKRIPHVYARVGAREKKNATAPNKARTNEGPTGVELARVRLTTFGHIPWLHPLGLHGRVHR